MAGTYAVIGDPIEHSMSPLIHNAAFKELGMDSSYIAYRIERGDLEDGIESLKSARIAGFNVTIPHKVDVLKYLDSYDDDCKQVGAANTVEISNGKCRIQYRCKRFCRICLLFAGFADTKPALDLPTHE